MLILEGPALKELLFSKPNVIKQGVIDTQMRSLEHHSLRCICLSVSFKRRRDRDVFQVSGLDSQDESPVSRSLCNPSSPACHTAIPSLSRTPSADPGAIINHLHGQQIPPQRIKTYLPTEPQTPQRQGLVSLTSGSPAPGVGIQ